MWLFSRVSIFGIDVRSPASIPSRSMSSSACICAQRCDVLGEQFVLLHLGEQAVLLAAGVRVQQFTEFLAGRPGRVHVLVPEGDLQCVAAVHDRVMLGVELGDHRDVAAPAVAAHRYQPRRRGRDPIGSPGRAASLERYTMYGRNRYPMGALNACTSLVNGHNANNAMPMTAWIW